VYEYLDAAIVRAPAWQPAQQGLPWPDLTGPDATPTSWRAWLDQVFQIPEFSVAVEAASPDLARRVAQIRAGRAVSERVVRRVVLSTLRYLLRAASRATPFGLFAGAAIAPIGAAPALRAGDRHRAIARAGAEWVTGVIEYLEADAALRSHLQVIASGLSAYRDGHLVIEHRSPGTEGGAPVRVQIRATPPVLAALHAARRPARVADLAAALAARFPGAASSVIDTLLAELVQQQFLITSLRPLMTAPDPLAALLDELKTLPTAGQCITSGVDAVRAALQRHDLAPSPRAGRDEREQVLALMSSAVPAARPVLAIDLRLDWDLVIPRAVASEAASAAGVLARLARRPALSSGWADWHSRFLDRYGPGAVVPVLDAVDAGAGLGYPAGYLGSLPAAPGQLTSRDVTLLKLASTAALRGCREVVLDDALIGELAVVGAGDPVQPGTELTVRIHAGSLRALEQGQFTLHVTGVSRAAGATAGRFLGVLDADGRMRARYAGVPGVHRGALLAQVSTVPLYASAENVARAPQAAGLVISLGEHREPGPGQIPLADLAITADARRLHLVSLSRRRPVHTLLLSAVDLAFHSHPLARFLVEAPVALAAACTGFDWGAASALPFLPALRYGRTIVSPARWVLTASDVPGPASCWAGWDAALAQWREQAGLPERVWLGEGDQCISLDMAESAHRALLREHLGRAGKALLTAAPAPGDLGWAGGRAHEIVIPLAVPGPAIGPVRWPGEVTSRDHGYLPGCDARLDLRLYARRGEQDAILTRHLLPPLGRPGPHARWWFVRYHDPEEHLRLRVTFAEGTATSAVEQLSPWTQALRRAGLISRASWETYYPETARFGGTSAIDAAEEFFAADSAAVLAQLAACARKKGPDERALTAASLVDIAAGLIGDHGEAMRWLIEHTQADSAPPPRAVYDQAIALASPASDHAAGAPAADARVASSWLARRRALDAYRAALERARTISLPDVLPDLLHLHHARMAGPDLARERASLHLARAAALSWISRTSLVTRS
jgi:lantibiotic biosynthesis protein